MKISHFYVGIFIASWETGSHDFLYFPAHPVLHLFAASSSRIKQQTRHDPADKKLSGILNAIDNVNNDKYNRLYSVVKILAENIDKL